MLYFNACPRCKSGTVQLESDFFGSYLSCLNCGFEKSAASVRKLDYDELQREAEEPAVAVSTDVAVAVEDDDTSDDFDDDFDVDDDELVELERAAG